MILSPPKGGFFLEFLRIFIAIERYLRYNQPWLPIFRVGVFDAQIVAFRKEVQYGIFDRITEYQ